MEYNGKDILRAVGGLTLMITILCTIMVLNGLHYGGIL